MVSALLAVLALLLLLEHHSEAEALSTNPLQDTRIKISSTEVPVRRKTSNNVNDDSGVPKEATLGDDNEVEFWQGRTEENPQDSNNFYQLSRTLSKRMNFDDDLRCVDALKQAVKLERTRLTTNSDSSDSSNLIAALRSLAMTHLRLSQEEDCLVAIDEIAREKAHKMPFDPECTEKSIVANIPFEAVGSIGSHPVAIETVGNEPILNPLEVQRIRDAAQAYRHRHGANASRFTMQYKGNSDVHLADLVDQDADLKASVDSILQQKIYPLVRAAFVGNSTEGQSPLCVYDALVVHYDAGEATSSGRIGASLPLHRDGGLFSVNIALNHDGEFEGGGTCFENLVDTGNAIRRPIGVGHALAHRSTERHAGAPTRRGFREILVVFLTFQHVKRCSAIERAFYLKEMAQQQEPRTRLNCHRLGSQQCPEDGEAQYWYGFHLIQQGRFNEGIAHLEEAVRLNPNDARTLAYLGLAYSKRWNAGENADLVEEEEIQKSQTALERAIRLEEAFADLGCNDDIDVATALLTLGEILVYKQQWVEATNCLLKLDQKVKGYPDDIRRDILREAHSLLLECRQHM